MRVQSQALKPEDCLSFSDETQAPQVNLNPGTTNPIQPVWPLMPANSIAETSRAASIAIWGSSPLQTMADYSGDRLANTLTKTLLLWSPAMKFNSIIEWSSHYKFALIRE